MYIKICGIKTVAIAEAAAQAGAHFIGLVFVQSSRRLVDVTMARMIAQRVKQLGAEPVAVFTEASADEMQAICQETGIRVVQLHGDVARAQHSLLPNAWQRIYVYTVNNVIPARTTSLLDPKRDFLLFDSPQPGSGKTFPWVRHPLMDAGIPWFLSGGLNVTNVQQGIIQLSPNGVDVSSGVEDETGEKSISLIQEFIAKSLSPARASAREGGRG